MCVSDKGSEPELCSILIKPETLIKSEPILSYEERGWSILHILLPLDLRLKTRTFGLFYTPKKGRVFIKYSHCVYY